MKYILVEYPKCSTCQKAKKFLKENKIKFEERNIITETPTVKELTEWIQKSGLPINKFFNTSGLLYRSMNLKEELNNLSDEEKIKLLSSDGMLIKRPLLIGKDVILLGFKEEEWKDKVK
jgi:arsenate reductase